MTNTIYHKRQITITNDFEVMDYDGTTLDRYDLTWRLPERDAFIDFLVEKRGQTRAILEHSNSLYEDFYDDLANYWSDEDRQDYFRDEVFQVPMMNALWYYPPFCTFSIADRLKTMGCITLLFDRELGRWAIGMCGGGMDLTPQLVGSFINLGKCVPLDLAMSMRVNYSAYVNQKLHLDNCAVIADAMQLYSKSIAERGEYLHQCVCSATDSMLN